MSSRSICKGVEGLGKLPKALKRFGKFQKLLQRSGRFWNTAEGSIT